MFLLVKCRLCACNVSKKFIVFMCAFPNTDNVSAMYDSSIANENGWAFRDKLKQVLCK